MAFSLFTKRRIGDIFRQYAPQLDPRPYFIASQVFPMRVNNYVLDNLIDWSSVPNDPMFRLVFPQPEMLSRQDFDSVSKIVADAPHDKVAIRAVAEQIRSGLNAHPAGQKTQNVPLLAGQPLNGSQHKYKETVLFFPTEGQFCHSYCTYCFRWAQFTAVGSDQQFQSKDIKSLQAYLKCNPAVRDVLFTGGDPMVMPASVLQRYISPLLQPDLHTLNTIRIGTKSLAYWPYRYLTDKDSGDLLRLFETVTNSGKQLAFQAHFTHPRELETEAVQKAIKAIRSTGAQIRTQAPLIRGINDDARLWADMWNKQVKLGLIPYYMFIERDTGPRDYFSVPLSTAYRIFSEAYANIAGTARTVRGPSMSTAPGKIGVIGIERIAGEMVFVLKFFQARDPVWTRTVFFAKFNETSRWIDELEPAFGARKFFFEDMDTLAEGGPTTSIDTEDLKVLAYGSS